MCSIGRRNRVEYCDYRSVGYGRYYQIYLYSVDGDENPTKIKHCPFCGTKLALPKLNRSRK